MPYKRPLIILFIFVFCAVPVAKAGEQKFYAKTLVLPIRTEPKTFNILVAQETASAQVGSYLFDGLTEFDARAGKIVPRLAEKWEVSPDGLTWTFYLRKQILWLDGEPFTAQDVVFTFNDLIFNPAIPNGARDIFTIHGKPVRVQALNNETVQFELPVPFAPFLMALSQPILPRHVLEESVRQKTFPSAWGISENPEHVVGTGPFCISKVLPGERIELVRNQHYWRVGEHGERLPKLDRIFLPIIPNAEGQLLRFLEGETDFYLMSGRDYPLLKPLEKQKRFKVYSVGSSLGSYFLAFNQQAKAPWKRKWFQNRDFRRSIAWALDRHSMASGIFNGFAIKQCSPLSPSAPFFYESTTPCYPYDPKVAKKALTVRLHFVESQSSPFLRDAKGNPVEIVLAVNAEDPARFALAQMIAEDIRRIGVKVHLQPMEFNALVSKLTVTQDWEVVLMGLTGALDPHFGSNVWLSNGNLHFWNPGSKNASSTEKTIDELLGKAAGTLDPAERKTLYAAWQKLVAQDASLVYTVVPDVLFAIRDRFGALEPTAIGGPFYPIEEVEVIEDGDVARDS